MEGSTECSAKETRNPPKSPPHARGLTAAAKMNHDRQACQIHTPTNGRQPHEYVEDPSEVVLGHQELTAETKKPNRYRKQCSGENEKDGTLHDSFTLDTKAVRL